MIFAGALYVIAVTAAGTLLLPRHVHVERQPTLAAAPEDISTLASSNAGYQRFNPYLTSDPALDISMFGPAARIGSGFQPY